MAADNPRLIWALFHIAHGLTVFPTQPNSKDNHKGKRINLATTDPVRAANLWRNGRDNIKALIQRGYICLDFDADRGGCETFLRLVESGQIIPTYIERSANGGYHVWYRIPMDIETRYKLELKDFAGMEIKGENNDATLAGSVVDGIFYESMGENPIADAPEWLLTILQANQPAKYPLIEMPKIQVTAEISLRERKWALSAKDALLKELVAAVKGTRHAALIRVSLRLGNLTPHYFTRDDVVAALTDAVRPWENEADDVSTLEKYVDIGAKTPKKLDTSADGSYRADMRGDAITYKDSVIKLPAYGKIRTNVGSMNADSMKAGAMAMLNKAIGAGDTLISMSGRELAEKANLTYRTAIKVLNGLEDVEFMERAAERSMDHARQNHIPDKGLATVWSITSEGIKALQQRLFSPDVVMQPFHGIKTTSLLASRNKKDFFVPTGSSDVVLIPTIEGSVTTSQPLEDQNLPLFDAEALNKEWHVFKHGVLPRKMELLLNILATGSRTTLELVQMTGLPKLTIIRLLNKAERWELIQRGARNVPHAIRQDVEKQIIAGAQAHGTQAKHEAKVKKHVKQREKFYNRLTKAEPETTRFYDADGVLIDDPYGVNDPF